MSGAVIIIMAAVARWEPDARGRLQQAAWELFAERGYDQTTVAEIAQRAGLTERTFFRHFTDKREVLFSGANQLNDLIVNAIDGAPPAASPMEAAALALRSVGAVFGDQTFSRRRQAVIDQHPELQERELIKLAKLAAALSDALKRRGVTEPAASLTAQTTIGVFHVAFQRWVAEGETRGFPELVEEALAELRSVIRA